MRLLRAADEAESQCVRGMNAVCHVALHAVQKARAIDVCGDAVRSPKRSGAPLMKLNRVVSSILAEA